MRVILVDDEPPALARLEALLADHGDVVVAARCEDGESALDAVRVHRPDLILLDVQMPEMDGLEVAAALAREPGPPQVVFVTAHDAHAVRAFELNAVDYLLKPVSQARLADGLARARGRMAPPAPDLRALVESLRPAGYLDRLPVRLRTRAYFVKAEEIDWIQAEGNYARLHTGPKDHLVRETLSRLAGQLDPRRFIRIHRSAIVHIDRVRELLPVADGDYEAVLTTGARLRVGRGYRGNLPGF